LVFSYVTPKNTSASELDQKQLELNRLQKEIDSLGTQLKQKNSESDTLTNEISKMELQLKQTQIQLQKTEQEISKNELESQAIAEQIEIKKKELAEEEKTLDESLKLIYVEGDAPFIETLFSSKSFSDALDRVESLSFVSQKVQNTITEIELLKKDLESKQAELAQKKKDLEELKVEQTTQKQAIQDQMVAKGRLLAETKGQEDAYQAKMKAAKEDFSIMQAEIDRIKAITGGESYGGNLCPADAKAKGFAWPTASHSVSGGYYAYYYSPGKPHGAIDIGGSVGTPIYASNDGVVADVVYQPNYNTYHRYLSYGMNVIVNHGGGYFTLYAHLSAIRVSVGQHVSRGQVIANMGNTGNSSGPHLHFEILHNGSKLDPQCILP